MVFYVRTRRGWDELVAFVGKAPSPVWVERDVLTEKEIEELRANGVNITNFTGEASNEPDTTIVEMHHPNELIWVEL